MFFLFLVKKKKYIFSIYQITQPKNFKARKDIRDNPAEFIYIF